MEKHKKNINTFWLKEKTNKQKQNNKKKPQKTNKKQNKRNTHTLNEGKATIWV